MNLPFEPSHLPFLLIAVLIGFTIHEYAHAASAYRFGDPTAYRLGRVTLNPVPHISLLGLIFILLLGFGWARPVPVDRSYFAHPRLMGIVVSALGPISNLIMAVLGAAAVYALFAAGWFDEASAGAVRAAALTFFYLIHINLVLFFFNLIPLPPLDGYRIAEDLAPPSVRRSMSKYEAWGLYVFLLIVFITPVFNLTLGPILAQAGHWREALLEAMASAFGPVIDWDYVFSG